MLSGRMVTIDVLHFLLLLLLAGFLLRMAEMYLLDRDPNSKLGRALAIIY